MNKIPLNKYLKIIPMIISLLIILAVSVSGITLLTARIILYNDILKQREYLNNLKLNPYEPVDEQSFCSFPFYKNPKINQIQFLSTHNSYKKKMPSLFYGVSKAYSNAMNGNMHLQYHHNTLTEQLNNGIRGLELDVRYQFNEFLVYHIPVTDPRSNCPEWKTTLEELAFWSTNNPNHMMVNIIIEIKNDSIFFNPSYKKLTKESLQKFDKTISETLGRNKLVTPDFLMEGYSTMEEMINNNGWPSFYNTRGKFMFLLHYHDKYTDEYISIDETLQSQIMVPMIESKYLIKYKKYASVLLHNEPETEVIQNLIQQNYMVRTRMDNYATQNEQRATSAINSGAQIITTDFEKGRLLPASKYDAYLENFYTVRLRTY